MPKSWVVRGYAAAVVVLGILAGLVGAQVAAGDPDPVAFDAAGRLLLTSGGLHVFDNSYLQVGPVYLLVEGLLSHIAGGCGLSAIVVESVFWSVVLLGWTGWLARALFFGARTGATGRLRSMPAIAIAAVIPLPLVACTGHFEELLTGLALLTCAVLLDRHQFVAAGLMLALAAGCKSWGVLGLPLLLLAPLGRVKLTAAATALIGMTSMYAPFAVAGSVATGAHVWHVTVPSALSLVLPEGTAFGLRLRLGQVAVVFVLASVAATFRRSRRLPATPTGVCVVILATRLVTDPYPQSYYVAPLILAVVLLALQAPLEPAVGVAAALGVAIGLDIAFAAPGTVGSWAQLLVCALAIAMGGDAAGVRPLVKPARGADRAIPVLNRMDRTA